MTSNDLNDTTSYKNVGIVSNPTLEDLSDIMPDVANSLREVLEYKGNVEDDLMLTFQVFYSHVRIHYNKNIRIVSVLCK